MKRKKSIYETNTLELTLRDKNYLQKMHANCITRFFDKSCPSKHFITERRMFHPVIDQGIFMNSKYLSHGNSLVRK